MQRYLGLGLALAFGPAAPAVADTIHFICTPAGAAARPFHVSFDTAANTVTDQGASHPMQVTPTDVTWTWRRVAPDQAPPSPTTTAPPASCTSGETAPASPTAASWAPSTASPIAKRRTRRRSSAMAPA